MTAPPKSPPQAVFKTKTKSEKWVDAVAQSLSQVKSPASAAKPSPSPKTSKTSKTSKASKPSSSAQPAQSAGPAQPANFAKPARPAKPAPSRAVKEPQNGQADLDAMLQGLLKNTARRVDAAADAAPSADASNAADRRCGLVAIVGKPNVGKSTLLNALVGQKISITSRKAQTTRHRITGMRTQGVTQFVFVDTPGFQTIHGNALNKSLNKAVQGAVTDVDLILLVVEAGSFTAADARVLSLLGKDIPVILVANKLDNVHRRGDIAPWLQEMQAKHAFTEFMPMSAKNPKDVERLLGLCEGFLPEQGWWYSEDELTDRSEKFLASELVREKLFRLTGDELPYTSTVVIDKFEEEPPQKKGQKRLLRIAATIVVERDGHKAMVIGDKGERIKRIGMETRVELEKLADAKVFLELWVKVRSGWADDEARVRSFGYE